jgi:hypothetical protein
MHVTEQLLTQLLCTTRVWIQIISGANEFGTFATGQLQRCIACSELGHAFKRCQLGRLPRWVASAQSVPFLTVIVLLLLLLPEYPHMGLDAAAPVEQGLPLSELFWGGRMVELEGGRKVIGQVWPKVNCFRYLNDMVAVVCCVC